MDTSIIIGMPTYGRIEPETMFSLIAVLLRGGPLVHDLDYRCQMYVDAARNSIVRKALDQDSPKLFGPIGRESTHLLFLDADMKWPSDTMERLLSHGKRVVSGTYFYKNPPHRPVAADFAEGEKIKMRVGQELPPRSEGLVKRECPGTGCLLVELDVFREMQEYYGDELWFRSRETGEDLWFFHRLKEMDIPVYLDLELECGHIGKQVITREHHDRYAKELNHVNGDGIPTEPILAGYGFPPRG